VSYWLDVHLYQLLHEASLYELKTLLLIVRDSGFKQNGVCSELCVEQWSVAKHLKHEKPCRQLIRDIRTNYHNSYHLLQLMLTWESDFYCDLRLCLHFDKVAPPKKLKVWFCVTWDVTLDMWSMCADKNARTVDMWSMCADKNARTVDLWSMCW
jgi:hypothetical protein